MACKDTKNATCIICGSPLHYFFSKQYPTYPGSPFKDTLEAEFHKCEHCGFVISATHQAMTHDQWAQLNSSWHQHFEGDHQSRTINQPPYADQALALNLLSVNGLIDLGNALDYAAGYGTLSRVLKKYFKTDLPVFDKYVQAGDGGLEYVSQGKLGTYEVVINSAMFEHVLDRQSLDEVDRLVSPTGVLVLHTLVCENIPSNPDWFYIDPMVHTALHTNKSMALLMAQWGYAASVYSPQAKCWFLFKQGYGQLENLAQRIDSLNRELQTSYFHYKAGFVDYWKGF